ncbi:MAG: hypothetical protein PHR26_00765 [Candidatus ainarchaeum sp.]|nr:hypothetical protein [Candidatus ainarchaeum sp.]MDD3976234.1 hypothetical protein [Candidatus ainarchaeum sp.]
MKNKGILFTIDGMLALIFISLLITINLNNTNNLEEIEKLDTLLKISDLLITSQHIELENINILEKNFKKIFPNKKGYIKINNQIKEIGKKCTNCDIISQKATYINKSNQEIYIEIRIYK